MLQCATCSAEVPVGARFCPHCGTASALGGAELSHTPTNYTPPHLAQRILANREALRGENKQVTVLFCDVVESTPLAHALGAEAMHALLSDFFSRTLAEVHSLEGTVNQFLGDGFMAIFGAPLAFEDHAARACLAALAIQRTMAATRDTAPLPGWEKLHVRIGLNSGQVVVGTIGDDLRMDYTAAGDTTHLAARLQSIAEADEILCSNATVNAARGAITVEALGAMALKGFDTPVPRFRVLAAQEHTRQFTRRATPFVGRETELAAMESALARAAAGNGGVVELEGEPGAGKSRLLAEFTDRLPAATKVVAAQCITYGNQRPNVPIVEIARGLWSHAQAWRETPQAQYVAALVGEPGAQAAVATMDPATVRGRTQQALRDCVMRVAAQPLLVIVVEDLHWADPSTLETLGILVSALAAARCLVVVTYRPGSAPAWPAAARLAHNCLPPLAPKAIATLMRELTKDAALSPALQAQVVDRAEGNPFFLEELVRAAVAADEHIPGDVFDVLGARIDRLSQADKSLLRAAACVGREFSLDLLSEIASGSHCDPARLATLTTLGFVEQAQGRDYRFVHALTQDVAYKGMLGDERKQWHSAAGAALGARTANAEDHCEDIARHYLLGRTPAEALPYLEAATAKAIRNHTLEAAYGYLQDAMRLFEAQTLSPEWLSRCVGYLLHAFPMFHFLHKHREYAAYLERYAPQVEALGVPALLGPFLAQQGHRVLVQGRYRDAEPILLRALAVCDAAQDPVNASHASWLLGWIFANSARFEESQRYGERSLKYLENLPIPIFLTFTYVGLFLAAAYRGRWDDAQKLGAMARDIGLNAHDDGLAAFGGGFLGWSYYERGDDAACQEECRKSLAIAPTDYFRGWTACYMAVSMARMGQAAEAVQILDQAVSYSEQAGHVTGYSLVAFMRGEALVCDGQYQRATREMDTLRELALSIPYPFVAAGALQVQAECHLRTDDAATALRLFEQAEAEFTHYGIVHRAVQAQGGIARARGALAGPHA